MEKQKRERNVNFTLAETEILVSLAESKKHVIENKKSYATTWQEKEKAWKDIETAFNESSGTVFRDSKHLKLKYEAMKRDTRKKSAVIRAERYRTGGGTSTAPLLTAAEEKIKDMILLSVEGNESCYDSDAVLPCTSTSITSWLPVEEQYIQPAAEQTLNTMNISDCSNVILQVREEDSEPPRKNKCDVSEDGEVVQCETDSATVGTSQHRQWKEWNPRALKTKRHPVLSKPKEKRPFDKLSEEKIDIAKIQKQILTEELEQKLIQRQILEKELEHKHVMHELEKRASSS